MTAPDILTQFVTENDINNTTAETDLLNYSVPGNTLGTGKVLRITMYGDYLNNNTAGSIRWRIYYGATEIYQDLGSSAITDANRRPWTFVGYLWARSATNSQAGAGFISLGFPGGATTGIGDIATDEILTVDPLRTDNSAEDSTASKNYRVTVVLNAASTNISIRRTYAVVELLQ